MRFQQTNHPKSRVKYRTYSPTSLTNAFLSVKQKGFSVRHASKQYNVPMTTLRDRVLGKIDPECVTTGRPPVFSMDDEVRIVNHLKLVATYGYGYTRNEVSQIASDYALQIGKRTKTDVTFTRGWLDGFFKRWPELKVLRPRSLELVRAKSASTEKITEYFRNLSQTVQKYNLADKPHLIFNVDEKGVSPNHTPPYVVAPAGVQVQAVTMGKSVTTTIIGCGNASGTCIPPYFIFQGKRWRDELLVGATPGVNGTVSETGWSNSVIFRDYLKNHFVKYAPVHNDAPILLLMDGHSTHVSVGLLEWAKSINIVIFILPAHTSHLLQPLDVACYGPFQRMFNNLCHKTMRETSSDITRYNICELSCKVYYKALSAENLISGFRSTGIYPVDRNVISATDTKPAEVFQFTNDGRNQNGVYETEMMATNDADSKADEQPKTTDSSHLEGDFFEKKILKLKKIKSTKIQKPRKCMSKLTSGKPVTEDETFNLIKDYEENKSNKSSNLEKVKQSKSKKAKSKKNKSTTAVSCNDSPVPGPSHICLDSDDCNSESDSEIGDEEKCCVCKKFTPDAVRNSVALIFTKWVQCSNEECRHWAHLGFCTKQRVIRRGDTFYCTHCHEE